MISLPGRIGDGDGWEGVVLEAQVETGVAHAVGGRLAAQRLGGNPRDPGRVSPYTLRQIRLFSTSSLDAGFL